MPIVAEVVDAVIGADTHRDTHTWRCAARGGHDLHITVANTDAGFTEALAWVAEHAPGPQMAAGAGGNPQLRGRLGPGARLLPACR